MFRVTVGAPGGTVGDVGGGEVVVGDVAGGEVVGNVVVGNVVVGDVVGGDGAAVQATVSISARMTNPINRIKLSFIVHLTYYDYDNMLPEADFAEYP